MDKIIFWTSWRSFLSYKHWWSISQLLQNDAIWQRWKFQRAWGVSATPCIFPWFMYYCTKEVTEVFILFLPHFSGVLPISFPSSEFQTKRPKSSHRCPQVLFSFKAAMMKFCAYQDPQQTFSFLNPTLPFTSLLPSLTQDATSDICFFSLLSLPKDFEALSGLC